MDIYPGSIDGIPVTDILIDAACDQSQVHPRLVKKNFKPKTPITLRGANSTAKLQTTEVTVRLEGKTFRRTVAINPQLTQDAIMGLDVPEIRALVSSGTTWTKTPEKRERRRPQRRCTRRGSAAAAAEATAVAAIAAAAATAAAAAATAAATETVTTLTKAAANSAAVIGRPAVPRTRVNPKKTTAMTTTPAAEARSKEIAVTTTTLQTQDGKYSEEKDER